jgi:Flp pilus assembly pilin Flp
MDKNRSVQNSFPNSTSINKQHQRQRGNGLIEYALLVALIAVACISATRIFGLTVAAQLREIEREVGGGGFEG